MMMSFDLNGRIIKLFLLTSIEDNLYKNVFQNRLQALFEYFICDHWMIVRLSPTILQHAVNWQWQLYVNIYIEAICHRIFSILLEREIPA